MPKAKKTLQKSLTRKQKRNDLARGIAAILRCSKSQNCLDWGSKNIQMPRHASLPGKYSWKKTPYLWRVAEALADPRYSQVVLWISSQSGKTFLVLIYAAHELLTNPRPIIIAVPSMKLSKKMSKVRFMELAQGCSQLMEAIKDGENSETFDKTVNGAPLYFKWTTSAVEAASDAAAIVILDEYDRISSIKGEGDSAELFETRTTSYQGSKIVKISTPLIEDESRIAQDFELGTKEIYHCLCVSCKKWFEPVFDLLKYKVDSEVEKEVAKSARVICPHCDYEHTNRELRETEHRYIGEGQEQKQGSTEIEGNLKDVEIASFRINGLFVSWKTIGEMAVRWWKASKKRGGEKLEACQTVMNTVFGQTFRHDGKVPDWKELKNKKAWFYRVLENGKYEKVEYYRRQVVPEIKKLVGGVDVQDNELYYVIAGFDNFANMYIVEFGLIPGDTREEETWQQLNIVCTAQYGELEVDRVMIDSRHRSSKVKSFARKNKKSRKQFYIPTQGRDDVQKNIALYTPDVDDKKMRYVPISKKKSLKAAKINESHYKTELYDRMNYDGGSLRENIYFPRDVSDNFLSQITGEKRVIEGNKIVWKETRENHYLDCAKQCLCLGMDVFKMGYKEVK